MNSSKRTGAATSDAAALKLLRGLLDQKRSVRNHDGCQTLTVREIVLRQVLKGAAEQKGARGAAFKFLTRYPADYAQALAHWQRVSKRNARAIGIEDLARGGVLQVPFPCDITKVLAHVETLHREAQVDFLAELGRQRREGDIPPKFLSQAWTLRHSHE
jgi:hypothetical protein